jgi:hypothetical protein
LFFFAEGFIDFIVDPSMQVMGDMVEKMVESFNQQQREAAAAAGGEDATSGGSNCTEPASLTTTTSSGRSTASRLTSQASLQSPSK